ncbi:uncharacterized protein QC761_0007520 [Podospora bellae-mahoneyi]|uniref:Uncharacterized protein n=1 Tax=Podospora bellae-mahoneyi TaxID=2093777 RepID=A0ABR0FWK5_9PEZI|nr:hypothetical protein QC761_0007520 [Podospora bellae-mahoneyi]
MGWESKLKPVPDWRIQKISTPAHRGPQLGTHLDVSSNGRSCIAQHPLSVVPPVPCSRSSPVHLEKQWGETVSGCVSPDGGTGDTQEKAGS